MKRGGWKIKLLLEKHISLSHVCGSRVFGKTNVAFLRKLFLQTNPGVQYDMQLVGCCEKHVALYQKMHKPFSSFFRMVSQAKSAGDLKKEESITTPSMINEKNYLIVKFQ
jgi:hypothetical protein